MARAPSREASAATREQFYEEHRPLGVGGLGVPTAWSASQTFVMLADGTMVKEPRDLLPNVAPDSLTAQAATRAHESADDSEFWSRVSVGVLGAGVTIMFSSLVPVVMLPLPEDPDERVSVATLGPPFLILGVGSAIALGGIIPMLVAQQAAVDSEEQRQAAFVSYDVSLRERLGLSAMPTAVAANARGTGRAPPDPLD